MPQSLGKVQESGQLATQMEMVDKPLKEGKLYIGVPKETSFQEKRVALTPPSVALLVNNGHRVVVETNAGRSAGYEDIHYSEAGAQIVFDVNKVFEAGIILKVAPATKNEINLMKTHQLLMSPLNIPTLSEDMLQSLIDKKITAIAYEYLRDEAGYYPIVRILSELAGSSTILLAAQYLSKDFGGKGILLGGVSALPPSKVVVLGAGVVGEYVARGAIGLGADVRIFDNNLYKLMRLQNNLGRRTYTSSIIPHILQKELEDADVVVGAIHAGSGRTPCVVTEDMVAGMKPGSVIIDVSIDQGGCFETSEITSHNKPTFKKHEVIHYCVPNMLARIPQTASSAFSNVITAILLEASDHGGLDKLFRNSEGTRNGVYVYKGILTNEFLSKRFDMKFTNLDLFLAADY